MRTHVYTRHKSQCPHRAKPAHRGCKCPKWIYVERTRQRISAKTRSWETAEEKAELLAKDKPPGARDNASEDKPPAASEVAEKKITIDEAIEDYLEDKRHQNLAESTLYKLDNIFRKQLGQFCREHAVTYPEDLTLCEAATVSRIMARSGSGAKEEAGACRGLLPLLHRRGMDE